MPCSHWEPCLQRITIMDCNAEVRDKLLLKQVYQETYIYSYLIQLGKQKQLVNYGSISTTLSRPGSLWGQGAQKCLKSAGLVNLED